MANKTTNYGLTKPLPEDFYNINDFNANMDIIDEELKKLSENTPDPSGQIDVHNHTVTLTTSGWAVGTTDERYCQTVNVSSVTTDTKIVLVDVDLSTDDADAKITYLEAWALPSANEVDQGNGTLTFYAWDKPTVNIPVNVGVM